MSADGSETLLYEHGRGGSLQAELRTLLCVLARHMDGAEAAEELSAVLAEHLPEERCGDVAHALQILLQGYGDDHLGWCRLLKCMHQEILAPAVVDMRMDLCERLAYKDVRGAWVLQIHFGADAINIRHIKGERCMHPASACAVSMRVPCAYGRPHTPSYHSASPWPLPLTLRTRPHRRSLATAEDAFFRFEWQLELLLDREAMTFLQVRSPSRPALSTCSSTLLLELRSGWA